MSQQWPPQQPGQGQPYDPYGQQPGQYTQPPEQYGQPQQGQYGPPAQPGQYGQQPGQGAPTYPQAPGYPPQYATPYQQGYPATGYGAPPPYGAPPQQPRSRVGLIVAIVAVIALLAVGAAYALSRGGTSTTATGTGTPTATQTTGPTATPTTATLYSNPMTGNVTGWPTTDGCSPEADGYHVTADISCFAPISDVDDLEMTVTAKTVGSDTTQPYGVTFRGATTSDQQIGDTYVVLIASDGSWAVAKILGGQATALAQSSSPSTAIHATSANTIDVKDKGTHITVSVNGTQLATLDDSSIAKGGCGLQGDDGGDVVFTNLSITK